jgi:hypothetical protein
LDIRIEPEISTTALVSGTTAANDRFLRSCLSAWGTLSAAITDSYTIAQTDERANDKFRAIILRPSLALGDQERVLPGGGQTGWLMLQSVPFQALTATCTWVLIRRIMFSTGLLASIGFERSML